MKSLILTFTIAALALAAAPSQAQQLDPIKGPISLQAPGPFYEGAMSGPVYSIKSDFARVKSFSYANGETLKGKSASVTAPTADGTQPATNPQNLAAAWDLIYGQGYYASHIAGKKILKGTFTGDKGTTLEVQSLDNYVAVAADNQGNLYKIVW
jgi:hypothetical protein